jgi:NADH:ubiquinone oxidoreductase subunit 3 (subunit A)
MDPGDLKYRRYPPDQAKINYFMVGLVVIVIILVIAFIALWALGPKRSNREKRYIERRKRKSLHIDARSRAGGRTYSGHKRRHHQKK